LEKKELSRKLHLDQLKKQFRNSKRYLSKGQITNGAIKINSKRNSEDSS
jgi:hypothetical protein